MKIKFIFVWVALLLGVCVPCAQAQLSVVKQDGRKIYLDTSDYKYQLAVGNHFKIILSTETLTNPKTGKELGLINHYSEVGQIIEVHPLYAVGQMPSDTKYTVGQEAVLDTPPVNARTTETAASAPAPVSNRKMHTYPVLEREVIGAVKAHLTADKPEEIAVLDTKGLVTLYTASGNTLQETAVYKIPAGQKPLSLSALDVTGSGQSQLFVAVYQENTQRIATLVLDVQNQEFVLQDTLPYFVKELGCGENKKIYAQKPFISATRAGNAHKLEYKDGRFVLSKDAFKSYGKWLSGINKYQIQNADTDNFVYTASNGTLRLHLQNGKYVESPAVFASAPNRIKYKQQLVHFYPALQVYGPQGSATLAALQNIGKLGLLSEQFGQYNGGKLHFLQYQNGTLKITETVELEGFAYDTTCTEQGILVPQIVSGGQTILTEIYR